MNFIALSKFGEENQMKSRYILISILLNLLHVSDFYLLFGYVDVSFCFHWCLIWFYWCLIMLSKLDSIVLIDDEVIQRGWENVPFWGAKSKRFEEVEEIRSYGWLHMDKVLWITSSLILTFGFRIGSMWIDYIMDKWLWTNNYGHKLSCVFIVMILVCP